MTSAFDTLRFKSGATMKNRFMLAPLTNCQSHEDGTLSDEEFHWLTMRATGGFAMTMTCAAHVQENGKGFPGQLGIFSDEQLPGHERLAGAIRAEGSLAIAQLHHGGSRCPADLITGRPVSASDDEETGARGLGIEEVEALRDDFIAAAKRAQRAGYDGVEVHGAHGYIVCQFLSVETNRRTDAYGGSLENRARLLEEIVSGIRSECGRDFTLGVRISPERFGMRLLDAISICERLIDAGEIDFLDVSLWNCFKEPVEKEHAGRSLMSYFTELDRKDVLLTVAGKIHTAKQVDEVLEAGVDFVALGRVAILHHDYPRWMAENRDFTPVALPVTSAYLMKEGLSQAFIDYMGNWPGFVEG
jgi:2,4-dienoyl-CoA reductase-like NADH-dependent reductase (Old Yellow Enzyme family)